MKRKITKVWNEILEGKNLDVYLTIAVCAILVVLDIFDLASASTISAGILATLIVLALDILSRRHSDESIKKAFEEFAAFRGRISAANFFYVWDVNFLKQELASATEVDMLALGNYNLISQHSEEIHNVLLKGGRLRFIYIKPVGDALRMRAEGEIGIAHDPKHLFMQAVMSLQKAQEFAQSSHTIDSVQVRVIDNALPAVMTMINPQDRDGRIYVTLNGFGVHYTSRPSFVLHKERDAQWYAFYQNTFENMWQCAEKIDLSESLPYKEYR